MGGLLPKKLRKKTSFTRRREARKEKPICFLGVPGAFASYEKIICGPPMNADERRWATCFHRR
jgi:hypothetical protein